MTVVLERQAKAEVVARARPRFTISEAAQATGVSRSTIKRRLAEFEHREQDEEGVWRIPIEDLLAAGFKLRTPAPKTAPAAAAPPKVIDLAANELEQVRLRLREEQIRREAAEEVAAVHKTRADDLRAALRMLEAGKGPQLDGLTTQGQPELVAVRGWFGRVRWVKPLDVSPAAH